MEFIVELRKQYINFTPTDKEVLWFLLQKPYFRIKTSPYNIAKELGKSESSIVKSLRKLKDLGITNKSMHGAWFIVPEMEEVAKKIVEHPHFKIKKEELGLKE